MSKRLKELHEEITLRLNGVVESPRREAELLLMAYLNKDQLYFITHQEDVLDESDPRLVQWVEKRSANVPLEYLTNRVSFYSREFYIDEGALIPRPETEHLIDEVLGSVSLDDTMTVVEVGVGSGIISILLALHLPNARFIAVDISPRALAVARRNIEMFGLSERIELREGNLLSPIIEKIDFLVSNPPYIAHDAPLESNLSYEPQNALFGGEIGDEMIRALLDEVYTRRIPSFACEMGYDQRSKVQEYLKNFAVQSLDFYTDYASFDRGFVLKAIHE
ncbi:peptide chain release factor N(5)-glutamine methyltransferase [Sulfuricurvum sp. RIFCSPLOWO2_12_FULL_43_24]|uniref:peptide chain release factor N(5)-glutamine methyltransferase n=1 Tax=Sulfuricurvum sp. RIFCSPLOWO2_12_FULL_43_24 TaxID=1802247 RepID=UPI0008B57AB9|nr:peptide chain release factor N(5)-glutamine methyltransferase [Sulfuricurvum sp. RIFCSPLOWO2_12_FULL_43_24]OHD82043.1 MAG: protein-(glutamine-N5) methyltransferase, release factor-specific [Sulfuricurvum sp. RIFCSPHIGHO2_02_FULL_43_9]OHD86394.1 MAG: protein-(glutamine-N5) methyltransferase, release factor-specific [Sulfuricurvum sp. RIFCSPLOWO2_02_FULL_43_45]OHD90861.1 MAG: protein-(glutamine-N5) methyltransferase, release factor-specific [Sulfuricurvum sp. RIFCSPLOWO2_12_FULL_43_24]